MGLGVDVGVDAQADARACGRCRARPRDSSSSSASLSTLKQQHAGVERARASRRASCRRPRRRSRAGSPPAASTRSSSPPETMSKPQPGLRERSAAPPGWSWPSSRSRSGGRGRRARAGRRPARARIAALRIDVERRAEARAPARRSDSPRCKSVAAAAGDVGSAGQVHQRGADAERCRGGDGGAAPVGPRPRHAAWQRRAGPSGRSRRARPTGRRASSQRADAGRRHYTRPARLPCARFYRP